MTSARRSTEFADLVAAQDRRLEREGIPMYLALVSETSVPVPSAPPALVASGQELAATLGRFRDAMAPNQRDGDHGVYISVMQAVSYCDFDASRLWGPPGTVPVGEDGHTDREPIRPHGPRDDEAAL